jgi:DNA-damage-inducible protein D
MSTELTLFHFDDDRPNWEDSGQQNGDKKWSESMLRDALGYQTPHAFRNVITRAMQACLSLKIQCEDNFVLGDGEYQLTRFACYLVAMNGDPKKTQVASAQIYFATVAETFQSYLEHAEGIDRLLIRDEIVDGEKSLSSTAKRHGVEVYAFFQNAGYRGMYNMDLKRLKAIKGIGDKESLLDRMGKDESAAHLFRITQTDAKITNERIRGQKPLENAAFTVGQMVRGSMEQISGTLPEHLPAAEPINQVRKKLKGTSKALGRLDGPRKKRPGGGG